MLSFTYGGYMTQKKKQNSVSENIDGFSQTVLSQMEHKPSPRNLFILKLLIMINNNFQMNEETINKKRFIWISYGILMKRLENLDYSRRMLQRDLSDLDALNMIDRIIQRAGNQTKVYFHITKLTRELYVFDIK